MFYNYGSSFAFGASTSLAKSMKLVLVVDALLCCRSIRACNPRPGKKKTYLALLPCEQPGPRVVVAVAVVAVAVVVVVVVHTPSVPRRNF